MSCASFTRQAQADIERALHGFRKPRLLQQHTVIEFSGDPLPVDTGWFTGGIDAHGGFDPRTGPAAHPERIESEDPVLQGCREIDFAQVPGLRAQAVTAEVHLAVDITEALDGQVVVRDDTRPGTGCLFRIADGQKFRQVDLLRLEVCNHPGAQLPFVDADIAADIRVARHDLQLVEDPALRQVGKVTGE